MFCPVGGLLGQPIFPQSVPDISLDERAMSANGDAGDAFTGMGAAFLADFRH